MATEKKKSNVVRGTDPETAINLKMCEAAKRQMNAAKTTAKKPATPAKKK